MIITERSVTHYGIKRLDSRDSQQSCVVFCAYMQAEHRPLFISEPLHTQQFSGSGVKLSRSRSESACAIRHHFVYLDSVWARSDEPISIGKSTSL